MKKIWLSIVICCFFVMSITSTFVWSSSAVAGPDDPDYIANVIEEALRIGEVQDPGERILLLQEMAGQRIEEIEFIIAKNKPEYIPGLVRAYETIVQNIEDCIDRVTAETGLTQALEAVSSSTVKHTEVLTALLEKVPEEARAAIEHTIEVSKRGRDTALDRLTKVQEGEVPRGRPEEVGKPERPEGVGGSKGTDRPCDKGRP